MIFSGCMSLERIVDSPVKVADKWENTGDRALKQNIKQFIKMHIMF